MHCKKAVLTLALLSLPGARAADFSGAQALAFTKRLVAFGPRPAGSEAIRKTQAYILSELKTLGCQVTQDDFTGATPLGPTPMKNIIARFPGRSGKVVAITGHYDTKSVPGTFFVGANDGGSSAAFLLEMAKALAFAGYDYQFVFGTGRHSGKHGGAILPESLKWLWREDK